MSRTGQHKMEVDAVENTGVQVITEPWMLLPGEINVLGNCYNCQQLGHIKSQCNKAKFTAPASLMPATNVVRTVADPSKCFKYNKTGHFARDCRSGARRNQPAGGQSTGGSAKKCVYGKKSGHLIGECRSKKWHEGRVQELGEASFPQED